MSKLIVDERIMKSAVYGGAVLGGGGGGKIADGLERGYLALERGKIEIVPLSSLSLDDIIVTASSVGSPKAQNRYIEPDYYVRAMEVFLSRNPKCVKGIITSENGAAASVNGWLQAASLGLPVLDSPCNGRAHPTGTMGSMGLEKDLKYISQQTAVGGNKNNGTYLELFVEGNINTTAELVRDAAGRAGGVVAVARNPVTVSYAMENAAPGGLSYAIRIGEGILKNMDSPLKIIESIIESTKGYIAASGIVEKVNICTKNSLDIGSIIVISSGKRYNIPLVNEYMSISCGEERIATFPDLICLIDNKTGLPICSADLSEGQDVTVIIVLKENMPLGKGVYLTEAYLPLEAYIGTEMIKYVFNGVCK